MAFDSARGLTVMFGGENFATEGTPLGDTWYYLNSTWVQATLPTSPPARIGPAMAYDSLHSQTVMFSGVNSDTTTWLLGPLTILLYSLPDTNSNVNYLVQLSADGGLPPYSFSVSGLPPGLYVNSGNQIVGQCTGESPTGVTITVTDSASPTHSTASEGPLPLHCNPPSTPYECTTGTRSFQRSVQFAVSNQCHLRSPWCPTVYLVAFGMHSAL